jgi:hypothetical protein
VFCRHKGESSVRSGFDAASYDWKSDYYEELHGLSPSGFVRHSFEAKPALVSRAPRDGHWVSEEYRGQPYDLQAFDLVPARWDHDTCKVCRFRIDPGHTYWETSDRVWILCDECFDHVAKASPK